MTFTMTSKLYTDEEIGFERVFEIRIRDIKSRNGVSQRSFSLNVKKGTKEEDYISTDDLKEKLQSLIKEHFN